MGFCVTIDLSLCALNLIFSRFDVLNEILQVLFGDRYHVSQYQVRSLNH